MDEEEHRQHAAAAEASGVVLAAAGGRVCLRCVAARIACFSAGPHERARLARCASAALAAAPHAAAAAAAAAAAGLDLAAHGRALRSAAHCAWADAAAAAAAAPDAAAWADLAAAVPAGRAAAAALLRAAAQLLARAPPRPFPLFAAVAAVARGRRLASNDPNNGGSGQAQGNGNGDGIGDGDGDGEAAAACACAVAAAAAAAEDEAAAAAGCLAAVAVLRLPGARDAVGAVPSPSAGRLAARAAARVGVARGAELQRAATALAVALAAAARDEEGGAAALADAAYFALRAQLAPQEGGPALPAVLRLLEVLLARDRAQVARFAAEGAAELVAHALPYVAAPAAAAALRLCLVAAAAAPDGRLPAAAAVARAVLRRFAGRDGRRAAADRLVVLDRALRSADETPDPPMRDALVLLLHDAAHVLTARDATAADAAGPFLLLARTVALGAPRPLDAPLRAVLEDAVRAALPSLLRRLAAASAASPPDVPLAAVLDIAAMLCDGDGDGVPGELLAALAPHVELLVAAPQRVSARALRLLCAAAHVASVPPAPRPSPWLDFSLARLCAGAAADAERADAATFVCAVLADRAPGVDAARLVARRGAAAAGGLWLAELLAPGRGADDAAIAAAALHWRAERGVVEPRAAMRAAAHEVARRVGRAPPATVAVVLSLVAVFCSVADAAAFVLGRADGGVDAMLLWPHAWATLLSRPELAAELRAALVAAARDAQAGRDAFAVLAPFGVDAARQLLAAAAEALRCGDADACAACIDASTRMLADAVAGVRTAALWAGVEGLVLLHRVRLPSSALGAVGRLGLALLRRTGRAGGDAGGDATLARVVRLLVDGPLPAGDLARFLEEATRRLASAPPGVRGPAAEWAALVARVADGCADRHEWWLEVSVGALEPAQLSAPQLLRLLQCACSNDIALRRPSRSKLWAVRRDRTAVRAVAARLSLGVGELTGVLTHLLLSAAPGEDARKKAPSSPPPAAISAAISSARQP